MKEKKQLTKAETQVMNILWSLPESKGYSAEIMEKQKSLQPGTCVAFGKAFKIPMLVKMPLPNPEPYSSNADIVARWTT